jgi:hypothetical protein
MTKETKKDEVAKNLGNVLNEVVKMKENKGQIPSGNKKIVIEGTAIQFRGKTLKIAKNLYKNGKNYSLPAGTKWEDIDNFHRINISFSKADFN